MAFNRDLATQRLQLDLALGERCLAHKFVPAVAAKCGLRYRAQKFWMHGLFSCRRRQVYPELCTPELPPPPPLDTLRTMCPCCSRPAGTWAAMFSRLTALVSGTSLPFDLGEEFPRGSGFGSWQHFRGTLRADGAAVSVFRLAAPGKGDARLEAGRHGVKRLRTLRHPNVLVFKDSLEVEERGEAVLYLVTEPVTPLSEVLAGMRGADREQYLCMGLSELVSALSFLANDAGLVHGAVSMGAVAVTQTLDWKLHGFDVLSEHQFASQYDLPLAAAEWLVPAQYKPGEVAKRDWQVGAGGLAVWLIEAGGAWGQIRCACR